MRAALVLGSLVLLLAAGAAPASTQDVRTFQLQIVKKDLYAAITTESRALQYLKEDDWKAADRQLGYAHQALFALSEEVHFWAQPSALVEAAPTDPWADFDKWTDDVLHDDARASVRMLHSQKVAIGLLQEAQRLKNHMYAIVVNELKHPNCTELVDVRGPITVNGVPQGKATVTVDFACQRPVRSFYMDVVGTPLGNLGVIGGTFTQLPSGVVQVQVMPNTRNIEISFQPTVAPSPAEKLDIVEIAGDSTTEYFAETM